MKERDLKKKSKKLNTRTRTFENASRVHDWRNHVPVEFKEIWKHLDEDERLIVWKMAKIKANNEDWY